MVNINYRDIGYNFPHWHYYLNLEKYLVRCFQFVEPSREHFKVYSEEFSRIILLAASEFENALKSICKELGESSEGNLQAIFSVIRTHYPNLIAMKFEIPRYDIDLIPLQDWEAGSNPDWWKNGYNNIKHDRAGNPKSASLLRALNALSSLQLVLLHLYKTKYRDPVLPITLAPTLIQPHDITTSSYWDTGTITWEWKLPDDPVAQTE